MAKLTNVRERIDDVLVFHTPDERRLTPLGEQEGDCDDSFVILAVACSPDKAAAPDELLRVAVNDRVALAWPIDDLHARWRRGLSSTAIASLLAAYGEAGQSIRLLKWLTEPGVHLACGIVIPPRSPVRVDTTDGTVVTAYLRGLRSRDVT